jgi:hypothetical protein
LVQRQAKADKMPDMSDSREISQVANPFQQWLSQGEQLYSAALNDFHSLEAQLDDLETKLAAKQAEVNQIAQMIGKPVIEGNRRLSAQIIPAEVIEAPGRPHNQTGSSASIARALTGKFGGR